VQIDRPSAEKSLTPVKICCRQFHFLS